MGDYQKVVYCCNCDSFKTIDIPKGKLVTDVNFAEVVCPNCGCKGSCKLTK